MGDWFLPVPALGRVQRSMGFYLHQPPVTAYEERHFSGSCAAQSKAHYHPTNHQPAVAHLYVGYDYLNDERYTMPDVSDGPYILLSDLDIEGKRTTNSVNGEGSMVKANQSMLADHWDTQEYVDVINGSYSSEEWLYQDVYILKNEDMVDRFVEVLMIDSVFAQSTEDYTRIEIPGLDQAWVTERLECIAVKGTTISIFTHPFDSPEGMREALEVVAEKWGK